MNRIFITGDMHGDIEIGKITRWKKIVSDLDETDILIVCGDMGFFWDGAKFDRYIKRYWEQQPFTVLWIDGNHENFDILNSLPITRKWGGNVQQCAKNVYHLCRGEVYNIYGKTFFCFGGASSHDKQWRTEGVSWWPQELPTAAEMENGIRNLEKVQHQVDYIVTHCADIFSQNQIDPSYEKDVLIEYLTNIANMRAQDKLWFVGHYHINRLLPNKVRLIYSDILEIE